MSTSTLHKTAPTSQWRGGKPASTPSLAFLALDEASGVWGFGAADSGARLTAGAAGANAVYGVDTTPEAPGLRVANLSDDHTLLY